MKTSSLPGTDGLQENIVVAFALIGIRDREVGDGLVELVALAQVAADLGGLARAGMGMGQGPATQFGVLEA